MDTSSTPSSLDPVGSLLDEFLSGGELGTEAFERFVARHPEHADALRGLHAAWARALAALPPERDERDAEPWGGAVPEAGTMLGGFRLIRLLGEGGMSRVWEAEQIALGRRVALKLVRPGLEPGGLHRLWREARAAGRINHRGIVPVFEVGEIEGQPFIVEQLVGDGTTLGDLIARGRAGRRPDPREVASRFVEIAEALEAAHEGGILHGDIKPQNILIDRDERPRVSDFGLSQMRGEGEAADHLRGTVAYMSPEQASLGRLDARSDVFSLGAVLYEALTLERALPGATTGEVLERHRGPWPPPAPHLLNRRVSRDLSAVCLRALARDPAERYGSLAALADDLGRVLRHEPTLARPVGPLPRAAKWARRNPGKAVALAMTAVLVAVLGAALVRESRLRQVAEQQAREARLRGYVSSLLAAQVRLEQGQPVDARRRLDDCEPDLRDLEWDLLSREAGSSVLVLGGHPPGPLSVAVSAGGDRVVTAAPDGQLRVFDGATGALLGSLRVSDQALGPVALAADRRTAAAGTLDGRVVLTDLERGAVLAVVPGHTKAVSSVAISGDGQRIVSASRDETVRSWDARTGSESVVLPFLATSNILTIAASRDASVLVSSSKYGFVSAWSASDGELISELNRYERAPSVVATDAAGARVAAGVNDGTVRAWDTASGRLLFEMKTGSSAIASVTLSGDGVRLAAAPSGEGPVLVWDVDAATLLKSHAGHRGRVTALAATQRGERLVAGCEDGSAYVWDDQRVVDMPLRWESPEFTGRTLAASGDGATVVTCATADRHLRVWRHGQDLRVQPAPSFAHCAALDGAGALLVAGLGDGSLALWSLPAPGVTRVLPLGPASVEALALAADGTRAIAASGHDLLRVDLSSGATARWSGHGGSITSVVAAADLSRVASSSTDGTVRLWDGRTGEARVLLDDGPFVDHVLAMDGAGRWLAASPSDGGLLHLYSLQPEPVEHARAVTPRGGVPCLSFFSEGRRLASSSTTSPRISLWDSSSGERLIDLTADEGGFYALAGGGPARLVGLVGDGSLRVWDADAP